MFDTLTTLHDLHKNKKLSTAERIKISTHYPIANKRDNNKHEYILIVKVIMTLKIKIPMHSSHWPASGRNRKKINNTQSNKNVKLPTLTLSYYVIIPFMKTMREKTIAVHVLNETIKQRSSKNINY